MLGSKPKKKMNLVARKKAEENINSVKQCNHSSYEFLEYLKENKEFNPEEMENIRNLQQHLLNMNAIFTDLQNSM